MRWEPARRPHWVLANDEVGLHRWAVGEEYGLWEESGSSIKLDLGEFSKVIIPAKVPRRHLRSQWPQAGLEGRGRQEQALSQPGRPHPSAVP